MRFYEDLQKYHNYTDYQIKLVQYTIKSFVSEITKFGILFVFFLIIGKLPEFLASALLLLFFRRFNGGLHCNTYVTCLIASFLFFFAGVLVLPSFVTVPFALGMIVMITMTIVLPIIAPIKSKYHAEVEPERIRKYKCWTFLVMTILTIIYYLIPSNSFLICGFWIVVIHTIQLSIAYIRKRRCKE